jgi:hypothetical protein
MPVEFIVEGRIVWGNPAKARTKTDVRTKQAKLDPTTGKPIQVWNFGLAVPKHIFGQVALPHLQREAASAFPNGTPQNFSWKFKDGDGPDPKGGLYSTREGWAGCYVLTVSTEAFAPQIYKQNGQGGYDQLPPEAIKCGDYVAVKVLSKYNGAVSPNTPGLYINPQCIVFLGYGQEIVSGADPEDLFAGHTFTLPQGASATPVMGSGPMPAGMSPAPQGYAPQAGYPQQPVAAPQAGYAPAPVHAMPGQSPYGAPPQGYAPAAPAPMPAPAHDFVRNAGQPQYAPAPQQQPVYNPAPAPQGYAPQAGYPQQPVAAPQGYPQHGMPGIPQGR